MNDKGYTLISSEESATHIMVVHEYSSIEAFVQHNDALTGAGWKYSYIEGNRVTWTKCGDEKAKEGVRLYVSDEVFNEWAELINQKSGN